MKCRAPAKQPQLDDQVVIVGDSSLAAEVKHLLEDKRIKTANWDDLPLRLSFQSFPAAIITCNIGWNEAYEIAAKYRSDTTVIAAFSRGSYFLCYVSSYAPQDFARIQSTSGQKNNNTVRVTLEDDIQLPVRTSVVLTDGNSEDSAKVIQFTPKAHRVVLELAELNTSKRQDAWAFVCKQFNFPQASENASLVTTLQFAWTTLQKNPECRNIDTFITFSGSNFDDRETYERFLKDTSQSNESRFAARIFDEITKAMQGKSTSHAFAEYIGKAGNFIVSTQVSSESKKAKLLQERKAERDQAYIEKNKIKEKIRKLNDEIAALESTQESESPVIGAEHKNTTETTKTRKKNSNATNNPGNASYNKQDSLRLDPPIQFPDMQYRPLSTLDNLDNSCYLASAVQLLYAGYTHSSATLKFTSNLGNDLHTLFRSDGYKDWYKFAKNFFETTGFLAGEEDDSGGAFEAFMRAEKQYSHPIMKVFQQRPVNCKKHAFSSKDQKVAYLIYHGSDSPKDFGAELTKGGSFDKECEYNCGKITQQTLFVGAPTILFIVSGHKFSLLRSAKQFSIPIYKKAQPKREYEFFENKKYNLIGASLHYGKHYKSITRSVHSKIWYKSSDGEVNPTDWNTIEAQHSDSDVQLMVFVTDM